MTVQSVFFLSGWGRVGLDARPVARVAKRRTHPGSICLVRRFEPYHGVTTGLRPGTPDILNIATMKMGGDIFWEGHSW